MTSLNVLLSDKGRLEAELSRFELKFGVKSRDFYAAMTRGDLEEFDTALFFLLRDHVTRLSSIVVDVEYPGKEPLIKEHLLNLLHRAGYGFFSYQIHFQRVGTQSPAHALALETLRGKRKPDMTLDGDSILTQFRQQKDQGLP